MDEIKVGDYVIITGDRLAIPTRAGTIFKVKEIYEDKRLVLFPDWKITVRHVTKLTKAQEYLYE